MTLKGDDKLLDLKESTTDKGYTQEELASNCDALRTTITMIELGENKPSVELAKKLGKIFDVAWSDFCEDTE